MPKHKTSANALTLSHPQAARRHLLLAGAAALAASLGPAGAWAQAGGPKRKLRIGFQKFNTLNILKGRGDLEKALAPLGVEVSWYEFPGGGQLTEALVAGAIDFGHASDGVGVFQQASGKGLAYLAAESPYPKGVGFLVPEHSPLKTIADLKGKRVATGRGYNSQYILIRGLEANGLTYADINPVYIVTASDTAAALQSGSVDAIGLWDPFLAGAQVATGARLLFDGTNGLSDNRTYHFAKPEWAQANQDILKVLFSTLARTNEWAQNNPDEVVAVLAPQLNVPPEVLKLATGRRQYGVQALNDEVAQSQQALADAFHKIGLIPKPIDVKEAFLKLDVL